MSPTSRPAAKPDPRYRDCQSLRKWIRQTTEGKQMLDSMFRTNCDNCEKRRAREVQCAECEKKQAVLIVIHPDGHLEIYGKRDAVQVRVENLADIDNHADLEAMAEEAMSAGLPLRFREVYFANCLLTSGFMRCHSPAKIVQAKWESKFIQELTEARKALCGPKRVVTKV